jgi:tetratricopeptide (TPR) repeat protein
MASIDQDEDDMTCADTDEEHEDYADPDALNGLAQVYELMSEMGVRRGSDDSVDYSKKAAEIMERLIEITKRREDPQFLAALRVRSVKHQSYREQENTYLSALELFRGLSKKAPTVENKRELIGALCNLSNFRMLQSRHGKNEHIPSVLAKGRAEIVAKKYGSDYQIPSELDLILDADALSREAFSLCEEVAVLTGEANDLRMIVNLCDQIGHITERLAEASRFDSSYMERYLAAAQSSLTYYDRAANASERLVKITDRVGDYELLAFVLENRSTLYIKAGGKQNTEKALEDDLRLIDVYQYMYDKTENPQYLKKINFKCYAVSELYDGLGDAERAAYFKGKTSYDPFG